MVNLITITISLNNSTSTPNSPVVKCEINVGHEVVEEDYSANSSLNNSNTLIPNSRNSDNNEDHNSCIKSGIIRNSHQNSKISINKDGSSSKLVLQLKEGILKNAIFCDKYGKYVWNGRMNTYWVVLCEDRLILFSNWKWFVNNNKSDRQKKDQSVSIIKNIK